MRICLPRRRRTTRPNPHCSYRPDGCVKSWLEALGAVDNGPSPATSRSSASSPLRHSRGRCCYDRGSHAAAPDTVGAAACGQRQLRDRPAPAWPLLELEGVMRLVHESRGWDVGVPTPAATAVDLAAGIRRAIAMATKHGAGLRSGRWTSPGVSGLGLDPRQLGGGRIWWEGCLSRVVARRGRGGGAASAFAVWAAWLGRVGGSACSGCSASWTWSRSAGSGWWIAVGL